MIDDARHELYEFDPTHRFSDRVTDYVRYRPGYPSDAIDAILDGIAPPIAAADVGAGTGIASRMLAERGVRVIAIEPNAQMRAVAKVDDRLDCRDGTAEATALERESVELVLCAQAFHWFRPQETLQELARILRPGGRLCLMWNKRDGRDPLTAGYRQAIIDVDGESLAERRPFNPAVVASTGHFAEPRIVEFANSQRLDLDGLIGRARSASYVPRDGPRAEELERRLSELFEQHVDAAGRVTLRYVTQVYVSAVRQ